MRKAGLRVDFISPEIIPAGNDFFDHNYRKDYTRVYHEGAQIVHNNVVRGQGVKKRRFQRYHLWSVDHIFFPSCERQQRTSSKAKALSEARALNDGLASNNATALNSVKASNVVTPTFFFQTASADRQKASGARSSMERRGRRGWSSAVLMSCLPLFLLGVFSLAYCVGQMKKGASGTAVGVSR